MILPTPDLTELERLRTKYVALDGDGIRLLPWSFADQDIITGLLPSLITAARERDELLRLTRGDEDGIWPLEVRDAIHALEEQFDICLSSSAFASKHNRLREKAEEDCRAAIRERDEARSALEDLQGEVGRLRAENEREEALKWFLKVLAGASGQYESGDTDWCPINCFCGDFEPTDTYNLAIERGFTTSSFNSMFETSTAYLTDAGREYIASAALNPNPEAK